MNQNLMPNKKVFTSLILFALLLVVTVVSFILNKQPDNEKITTFVAHGAAPLYSGVEKLEENADLIVKVVGTNQVENHVEFDDEGLVKAFWSSKDVNVIKVFGPSMDVEVGNKIVIYEPEAVYKNKNNETIKIIMEDYIPIQDGKEYILFLKKHPDGGYYPVGGHQGKISIDDNENVSNMKLAAQVKEKYKLSEKVVERSIK